MTDREEATQSRLIDLMQDAIDMTLTSSEPSSADSSTRASTSDYWTEIRADPTAYMAGSTVFHTGTEAHDEYDSDDYTEIELTDHENQSGAPEDAYECDDDFDITSSSNDINIVPVPAPRRTIYRASHDDTLGSVPRRTVNVHEDEGIWILLDEGCNSNCHGKEWAKNAGESSASMDSSSDG